MAVIGGQVAFHLDLQNAAVDFWELRQK